MATTWEAIDDDKLLLADKTVAFLQSEFCPPGVDPMWSEDYLKWKLSNINPAGRGYLSVALYDNQVIGTVSLTRKRILINGTEYIGGEVGDTYSSSRSRRRIYCSSISKFEPNPESYINKTIFGRLASDVRARAEENGVTIIYGTPNSNAYPGWTKRLGYFDLIAYDNRSYVRPTVSFITENIPSLKSLQVVLCATEALWLNIAKLLCVNKNVTRFNFQERTPSEEEIDSLWYKVKPAIGFSLVRDSAYWVHRYIKHPLATYEFLSIYENSQVVGLIVTRKLKTNAGKVIVYIMEWMMNIEIIPLEYVLYQLIDIYKNRHIDALSFYASDSLTKGKYAFKNGVVKRNRVPIIFANTAGAQILKTMNNNFQFYIGSTDAV